MKFVKETAVNDRSCHEPSVCSAGWQPAVSPTGSRRNCGISGRLRIANPRYSRLTVCATFFEGGRNN